MAEIIASDAIGLLRAADELELTVFLDYIQKQLAKEHISWVNDHLVELLHTCTLLQSCKKLLEHCKDVFSKSPGLIFDSADFTSLEHDELKALLQLEKLLVDEIRVWDKIIVWGTAQLPELSSDFQHWTKDHFIKLREVIKELVPLIRFVNISSGDFCHKVMPYKRILPKELFREIMCFYLDPDYVAETEKLLPSRGKLMNQEQRQWILGKISQKETENKQDFTLKLLYRGTRDGFSAADFHRCCDSKGPTLAVMQVSGTENLVGGYSPISWTSPDATRFVDTTKSFVFSFRNSGIEQAVLSTSGQSISGVFHSKQSGASFGSIINHTSPYQYGFPRYQHALQTEKNICHCQNSGYSKTIFPDSKFEVDEYEVYQVLQK
jgi:hypothetical protein